MQMYRLRKGYQNTDRLEPIIHFNTHYRLTLISMVHVSRQWCQNVVANVFEICTLNMDNDTVSVEV